jgi:membrane-associated phospholipid phosphatase
MLGDEFRERTGRDVPKGSTLAVVTTAALVVVLAAVVAFDVAVAERGVGVFEPLSPPIGTVLAVAGLVTQLGDPWFLVLVATFAYLVESERSFVREPRDGAFVLAVTFAALALIDLLKNLFVAPRPPGAETVTVPTWLPATLGGAFESITTGTGYAFPSGHAIGTTAAFVALAYKLNVGSSLVRWAIAGTVVVLVVASRVVLGVHYVVDVGVGVLAGVSLATVAMAVGDREPLNVFALGTALGVLAVIASALSPAGEVWAAGQWLGASLGAGVAWYTVRPTHHLGILETLLAGVPIGVVWVGIYVTSPPLVVTVLGTAVAAGLTILAPSLVDRVSR